MTEFTKDGFTYRANDACLFNPVESNTLPYIGRLKKFFVDSAGFDQCTVNWFYRPDDVPGGRKEFHGRQEMLYSDHTDNVYANSIISKCYVHDLPEYEALKKRASHDYFARFTYKFEAKAFLPDQVPVYCICEQPYCPDKCMAYCQGCEDWYHLKCVGDGEGPWDMKKIYYCRQCRNTMM